MEKEGKRGKKTNLGAEKGKKNYLIIARIEEQIDKLGISKPELVTAVREKHHRFAKNTLHNWKARGGTIPPADIAIAIADVLQCSVRWLITGANDKEEEYTVQEKALIKKYRGLNEQGKRYVEAVLNAEQQGNER